MSVSVTTQSLRVDGLTATIVTAIERDPTTGDYVREFRFFGEAEPGQSTGPLVLTIRAVSNDEDALGIKTPAIVI